MINLTELKPALVARPPRIAIYGQPKIGKSTFASQAPNPIFLDLENGSENVKVARVPGEQLQTLEQIDEALMAVYQQPHNFETLVLDSATALERIIQNYVARKEHKKTVADIGYGKGYAEAANLFSEFLGKLDMIRNERNMIVILVGHAMQRQFADPTTQSYSRFCPTLNEKCAQLLEQWTDCLFYAGPRVFTKSEDAGNKKLTKAVGGERVLFTSGSPSIVAGNRYGIDGPLELSWDAFYEAFVTAQNKE